MGLKVRASAGALLCVMGLLAACVPPDPPPTLRVATAALEPGVAGVPFRAVLAATGGTEPYTWTSSDLPSGFEIDPLGLIAGDPTTTGTHAIAVTVQDASGATATRDLTLDVPDSLPESCIETSCEDVELADGVVEVAGDQILDVETGPDGAVVAVLVSGSALPDGQVVVFGETAVLPTGYIAEVTTSSVAAGGATRLGVMPATITDAYDEATIKAVPDNLPAQLRGASAFAVPAFSCSGGVTVDSGSTTATASLSPSGVIQKNRPIFGDVEYIQVGVEGSITVSLDVGISGAATCTASLALPPAVIGPVDLKVEPTLTLQVSGAAQLATSVTLKCGVYTTWYPSKGAITSRWCHSSGQPLEFTGGARASLTADLKPTVSLKGLVGLEGSLAPTVTAEYAPPTATISANWSGTLDLCVVCLLDDPWLTIRVLSYTSPTKTLWRSNTAPGTTTTTTALPPTGGRVARASVDNSGFQAGGWSGNPAISDDGRFVAFTSAASNLVPGDANDLEDVFVHDRDTGATNRVSVASDGSQSDGRSDFPAVSADGRFVTFSSDATNLVEGDTNDELDVFVHDRASGETRRISVADDGSQANGPSSYPEITGDGRFVVFPSDASNLVAGDTNGSTDVFVHDLQQESTVRVSVASGHVQANDRSDFPVISDDGRFVAFDSVASNLAPGDSNEMVDVFVHDRATGDTTRVSVANAGGQADGSSSNPTISGDGRFVAFDSSATNLGGDPASHDVYLRDRENGTTTRVSTSVDDGDSGNNKSGYPAISADGRYLAFNSLASDLVEGDTNGTYDVFLYDRIAGITGRVSVADDGVQGDDASLYPTISGDGRYIGFDSHASNLVQGDTNGLLDVFVIDRAG